MKTGVYTITNIVNNKIYVGSAAVAFIDRFTSHKKLLKENRHFNRLLQNAYNKYGLESLKFEILETYLPEHCLGAEQYWMNMLNSANRKYGYNLSPTAGNNSGYKFTKEQKEKMKLTKVFRGTNIFQYDLNGNFIQSFKSLMEAERILKISHFLISMNINNRCKTANNFIFKKEKFNKVDPIIIKNYFTSKINQYSLDGTFIKTWENIYKLPENYNRNNIIKVILNKRNSAENYIWKIFKNTNNINKVKYNGPKKVIVIENNNTIIFDSCVKASKYLNISNKLCHAILTKRIKNSKKLNGKTIEFFSK